MPSPFTSPNRKLRTRQGDSDWTPEDAVAVVEVNIRIRTPHHDVRTAITGHVARGDESLGGRLMKHLCLEGAISITKQHDEARGLAGRVVRHREVNFPVIV